MKTIITLLFVVLSVHGMAQGISGKVLDEKKEPLINAAVQVFSAAGIQVGGNVTDYDGNYLVKPLEPGYYNVLVRYAGYDSSTVTGVIVTQGEMTKQNFGLLKTVGQTKNFVGGYTKTLVDIRQVQSTSVCGGDGPGVYHTGEGRGPEIGGARTTSTQYIIDGVMLIQPVDQKRQAFWENNRWWNERLANHRTGYKFTREDLASMPISNIQDAISLMPGVYKSRRGNDVSVFGSRYGGTQYIIDGIRQ